MVTKKQTYKKKKLKETRMIKKKKSISRVCPKNKNNVENKIRKIN